jgi:hypothetical protein
MLQVVSKLLVSASESFIVSNVNVTVMLGTDTRDVTSHV